MEIDLDLQTSLAQEEEALEQEEPSNVVPPDNIFTYSESRSCADITRMVSEGDLKKDPFFQRHDVWSNADKTRFIDSLLKRMPIPSMCFSVDAHEKYNVIDGRQRTSTIVEFVNSLQDINSAQKYVFSDLQDVDPRISGKNLLAVKENTPEVLTIIKNATIPINMLKCDYNKENNMQYIFKIFHRLNSGGVKLNNQEIRNCIYSGEFNQLLNNLNNRDLWKNWIPRIANNERLKGAERILTFFAFFYFFEEYSGSMASFLNRKMEIFSLKDMNWIATQKSFFDRLLRSVSQIEMLDYQKNVYVDAVLYGVSKNLDFCLTLSKENMNDKFRSLLQQSSFSKENLKEGMTKTEGLKRRLADAKIVFSQQ